MADKQTSKIYKKRDKQPISIPFLWEEVPGTPKKDWKPTPRPINQPGPPVKLVVSVPFTWEEKPGTPLPDPPAQPPPVPAHGPIYSDKEHDEFSDCDIALYSCQPYDSFSSAAASVQQTSFALAPGSPDFETDSSISSYDTGSMRFSGASFLGILFPLLAENSSFRRLEKDPAYTVDVTETGLLQDNDSSRVRRPLLTLGELIVMSRRMSCRRKVVSMKKQPSMGDALGCCINCGNGFAGLLRKWKRHLQFKLI